MLGVLKGKPPAFPTTSVSGARSPIVISILRGTRGPQVTAASCPLRYEEIQRAQEELGAGVAEAAVEAGRAFAAVQQANADMAEKLLQVVALGQVSSVQAKAPACIPTPSFTCWAALPPRLGDALMETLASLTPQQVLPAQAGALAQDLAALEQAAEAQEPLAQQAVEASRALAARLRRELHRTRGFVQVIAAHLGGVSLQNK